MYSTLHITLQNLHLGPSTWTMRWLGFERMHYNLRTIYLRFLMRASRLHRPDMATALLFVLVFVLVGSQFLNYLKFPWLPPPVGNWWASSYIFEALKLQHGSLKNNNRSVNWRATCGPQEKKASMFQGDIKQKRTKMRCTITELRSWEIVPTNGLIRT